MMQEHHLIPYTTADLPPGPWLVFAPHPDDESFGMGGTLLLAARAGIRVSVVVLTNGARGGDAPEALVAVREAEAREAARRLGIGDIRLWGEPDRGLRATSVLITKVADLTKELQPASVFFPSPMEPHIDHRAAAVLVWKGLQQAGYAGGVFAYEIGVQGQVNRLIDISSVVEEKRAVMAAYASQLAENDYVELVLALNKARTYTLPAGVTHAEGLFAYDPSAGRDLMQQTLNSLRPYWQSDHAVAGPLVSVIVRTKDRPGLLTHALQSVAEQTYPNIELIVVNDGGEDVAEVVHGFDDVMQSVRYVSFAQNRGRTVAANVGLDEATGAYLIFLDDDDWFMPMHIASLVDALEGDSEAAVAYAGVECVRTDASGDFEHVFTFRQSFDPVRLLVENYIPMHAALFRRQLVEAGCRLDESMDTYEDWDFWVQLAEKAPFHFVDQVSAGYRIAGSGGFGVAGDTSRVRQGLTRFYEKWRSRWSAEQLQAIADYAKHEHLYRELRANFEQQEARLRSTLADLQAANNARQDMQSKLEQSQHDILWLHGERQKLGDQLQARADELQQARDDIQELHREKQELGEQLVLRRAELQKVTDEARHLAGHVHAIEHSHSWRVTAPLRWVSIRLRSPVAKARARVNWYRRYGALSYQILRTEGPGRLLERIRGKLGSGPAVPVTRPLRYERERTWQALSVVRSKHPRVSVVVPVSSDPLTVFTCIRSLQDARSEVDWEVIAVHEPGDNATADMLRATDGVRLVKHMGGGGYFDACDAGAKVAGGDYLLFISDSCKLVQGDLTQLLATFNTEPDAGLVGVRLVTPAGALYQAGGIVWRDGAAVPYGHGDDPGKPQYGYLREVDFCASACLAMPRQLFGDLEGFGNDSRPLGYQHIELAFRVKQAGRKVIYQPAVTVAQFAEPVTASSAASEDERAAAHRQFVHRWRDRLGTHRLNGVLPELEKDRGFDRRVLVIDAVRLTPDRDSGSLRMVRILELFRELGFKATFVASNLEHGEEYGTQLQQRGVEVLHLPFVCSIEQYLRENGKYFDVVLVSRAVVAEQFLAMVKKVVPQALLVFDTVDLHFLREERLAELEGDKAMAMAARIRKEQELAFAEIADVTVVVSPVEKEILLQERPDLEVAVLSNIHVVRGSAADFADREGIMFIGGFNHPPNTDAVLYLAQEILPLVRGELGDVTTYIVGDKPPPKVKALASETIKVTGYVPDLEPYLEACRLTVAPLRYGAGVKGKVNMSMAHGVPVVATPMAVEGMQVEDGDEIIIGHDAETFARGVVRLYQDPDLWRRISANGLHNVERHFSMDAARQVLKTFLSAHGLG